MIVSALLAAVLCAPQVRLAPDQPLPYAFADEPVIVEFRDEHDLDFDVMIVYGTGQFPSNSHGLGPISLHAGRPYWSSTNLDPVRYGPHTITLNLQWPTGSAQHDFRLQRIRRPDVVDPVPLMVRIPSRIGPWDTLRRVLPATQVSIESTHTQLLELAEVFVREGAAVRLMLRGDADSVPDGLAVSAIAIPAEASLDQWARTARRLRERLPAARVILESPAPAFLERLLQSGGAPLFNAISVESPKALVENRAAAERQGYENLPFSVYVASAIDLLRAAEAWNVGADVVEVNLDPVWFDDQLTPEFGRLNAMIHLCDRTRVAGRYAEGDLHTVLLRSVDPERRGEWLAPAIGPAGLAGADRFADENGNIQPQPPSDPAYVLGKNPDVVLAAVAGEIRKEAARLQELTAGIGAVSEELEKAISRLTACDGTTSMRAEFFSLLRALPVLEESWHSGPLRKRDAVPAIAGIDRLVRRLAVLEQALGIPFVEPLEDTLDRCAEQQALYLTATTGPGASAERGERLMMHISSLIVEARVLHDSERLIEGDAIAALAEWRARSLVHAAKARPLTEQDPPQAD